MLLKPASKAFEASSYKKLSTKLPKWAKHSDTGQASTPHYLSSLSFRHNTKKENKFFNPFAKLSR